MSNCPCGLLLVNHDDRFLQRFARTRWQIEHAPGGAELRHPPLPVAESRPIGPAPGTAGLRSVLGAKNNT